MENVTPSEVRRLGRRVIQGLNYTTPEEEAALNPPPTEEELRIKREPLRELEVCEGKVIREQAVQGQQVRPPSGDQEQNPAGGPSGGAQLEGREPTSCAELRIPE